MAASTPRTTLPWFSHIIDVRAAEKQNWLFRLDSVLSLSIMMFLPHNLTSVVRDKEIHISKERNPTNWGILGAAIVLLPLSLIFIVIKLLIRPSILAAIEKDKLKIIEVKATKTPEKPLSPEQPPLAQPALVQSPAIVTAKESKLDNTYSQDSDLVSMENFVSTKSPIQKIQQLSEIKWKGKSDKANRWNLALDQMINKGFNYCINNRGDHACFMHALISTLVINQVTFDDFLGKIHFSENEIWNSSEKTPKRAAIQKGAHKSLSHGFSIMRHILELGQKDIQDALCYQVTLNQTAQADLKTLFRHLIKILYTNKEAIDTLGLLNTHQDNYFDNLFTDAAGGLTLEEMRYFVSTLAPKELFVLYGADNEQDLTGFTPQAEDPIGSVLENQALPKNRAFVISQDGRHYNTITASAVNSIMESLRGKFFTDSPEKAKPNC